MDKMDKNLTEFNIHGVIFTGSTICFLSYLKTMANEGYNLLTAIQMALAGNGTEAGRVITLGFTLGTSYSHLDQIGMNKMNFIIQHLLSILSVGKSRVQTHENSASTAAVPSQTEPEELHRGKRRLKENYTSHWDMDYLPRKEVEELMMKERNHKDQ